MTVRGGDGASMDETFRQMMRENLGVRTLEEIAADASTDEHLQHMVDLGLLEWVRCDDGCHQLIAATESGLRAGLMLLMEHRIALSAMRVSEAVSQEDFERVDDGLTHVLRSIAAMLEAERMARLAREAGDQD